MIDIQNNRVLAYAQKLREKIATGQKPDGSPMGDLVALEEGMALSMTEFFAFQDAKSRAQLSGKLTYEEAITVYAALGEGWGSNGGWAAGTDLAMKVTVTNLMGQLIDAPKKRRR